MAATFVWVVWGDAFRYRIGSRERRSVGPVCIWSLNITMGERGLPALHSAIPTKRNINDNNFHFCPASDRPEPLGLCYNSSYFEILSQKTVYRPRPSIVLS